MIFSIHQMGAMILATPELELDQAEADRLAKAAGEVAKHYAVAVDPKKLAWANLIGTLGFLYVPRIIAARARHKRLAAAGAQARPVPVSAQAQPVSAAPRPNGPPRPSVTQMAPSELFGFEGAADFPGLG